MKEIKDNINRWRDIPCSWIGRIIIVKMTILPTVIYRFNAIPIKLINFLGVWASLIAQLVKMHLQCRRPGFAPWVGKIPWKRESLPTAVFWPGEFHGLYNPWGHKELDTTEQLSLSLHFHLGFPHRSVGKESARSAGDPGSIPGQEDPLEKEMATHPRILAWRIP